MLIVDAHQDIAYNALCFGRDYRRSVRDTRMVEAVTDIPAQNGAAAAALPDALLGRVGVVFATLFTAPAQIKPAPWDKLWYKTPQEAHNIALKQWDYYQRLADETEQVRLIAHAADLEAVLATWADGVPMERHQQGMVLLMENADPIIEPQQFEEWYGRGVRIVGPAWQASRYSGGTGQPGGLTAAGRELLEVMAEQNAILDVSHMAEQAFFEAIDRYEGAIIASHSNPRRFSNTDRQLSDAMIRALAERDAVIGLVLYNRFLSDEWRAGDPKLPFATALDVIDHICQLTGSAAHVGIGTDFDGGFGAESVPAGIDTVTDLHKFEAGLQERGYSAADIEAVLSGNMLRKLRQALR